LRRTDQNAGSAEAQHTAAKGQRDHGARVEPAYSIAVQSVMTIDCASRSLEQRAARV
jgi:hypothetical protein